MKIQKQTNSLLGALCLGLLLAASAPSARANVYATNLKINGGMTNLTVAQGGGVTLSYILNEPASAGVTIKVLSGSTAVRTISLASGSAGTTRGLNTYTWNGKDDSGRDVGAGAYAFSITAASGGYPGWTKISDDENPGNYVWESRGIAVDRNATSPYYGRVFVGNSYAHSTATYGDRLGVQKLNADGSYADEGGFSDGGIAWRGGYYAPWKIRVSDDDFVYVMDWYDAGDIYRFDGALSSSSALHVFAPPADASMGNFAGMCFTGQGTNTTLWAADANFPGSLGIMKYPVKPDGTFDISAGTQVVGVGGGDPGMNLYPFAVAVDKAGAMYALQNRSNQGDPSAWVLRFPAYDPSTNGGYPEYFADWLAGPGDDFNGGHGIAVDPSGTYVAACFWGYGGSYTAGNIKVLYATNGVIATNLDLGISFPSSLTTDPAHHMDTDCDWDAVGNLYYLDDWTGCWRAFSPPGANQTTTKALAQVQVVVVTPPRITSIAVSGTTVTIKFTGDSADPAGAFKLLSAATPSTSAFAQATGAVITGSGGSYQATVPMNGSKQFYRIQR
jgi:hypothetical protein